MRYWLDLFTPYTWTRFIDHHGAHVSGFHPRQRKAAFERVEQGDLFLCYLVKLSRWCGALEVTSQIFDDDAFVFAGDDKNPFSIRFKVAPRVLLPFEQAIPIQERTLWDQLSFTRSLKAGSVGWGATNLRQSLVEIPKSDGLLIAETLQNQAIEKRIYPLDSFDLRRIRNPTVVRTAAGEVEVEVPERQYELEVNADTEPRASTRMQAKVGLLGAVLDSTFGFRPATNPAC